MKEQYHFETALSPKRPTPRQRRLSPGARDERRAQQNLAAAMREIGKVQAIIEDLERGVAVLENNIDEELATARVRNPGHCGYPLAARALTSRRENLKATISDLSERLSELVMITGKIDRLA